jgi:6-phosphogluconolactonase
MSHKEKNFMKLRKRTSFILVVTSALVGIFVVNLCACGGGAAQGPLQPPPSMEAAFVYTANGGSDDVTALKENLDTGSLSTVSGSPFHAGDINENVPGVIAVTPDGKFLYVGNANSAQISAFSINGTTGLLTEVSGSPFPSGPSASVRVHPSGKFLYAANFDQGSISVFGIDPATGVLSEILGSPFGLAGLVMSLALHNSGNFLYATYAGTDGLLGIAVFSVDPNTGVITRLVHSRLDLQAGSLTMHPSGKFLYSARNNLFLMFSSVGGTAGIWTMAVDSVTGALTLPSNQATPAVNPTEVAVDPSGKFAYVSDDVQGTVGQFTIDSSAGVLTHVVDVGAGNQPFSLSTDAAGKFIYVANAGSNDISAFATNASTGGLTAISGSPFSAGTTPRALVTVSPHE